MVVVVVQKALWPTSPRSSGRLQPETDFNTLSSWSVCCVFGEVMWSAAFNHVLYYLMPHLCHSDCDLWRHNSPWQNMANSRLCLHNLSETFISSRKFLFELSKVMLSHAVTLIKYVTLGGRRWRETPYYTQRPCIYVSAIALIEVNIQLFTVVDLSIMSVRV